MTAAPGPPERNRTLLYLLVFAGTAALMAGLAELFALGQLGPGPYFNVALGSSVLIVSVLFLAPRPAVSASAGTVSGDLPDPLDIRPSARGGAEGTGSAGGPPLGTRPGQGDRPPSLERPGTVAATEAAPVPPRPWQVRTLPSDLAGGRALPRNPEGVLETLDQLAEELTRPIPGTPVTDPGGLAPEERGPPPIPVDEEDLARPVSPERSPLSAPPGGDRGASPPKGPLELPTEEDLLHAVPPFGGLPQEVRPTPRGGGDHAPVDESMIRPPLDPFRGALPTPPGPVPRRATSLSARPGQAPSPPRAPEPSPRPRNLPGPDSPGPADPFISEEDLQGMLWALEQRLRSQTAPAPGTSPRGNRNPWDPSAG